MRYKEKERESRERAERERRERERVEEKRDKEKGRERERDKEKEREKEKQRFLCSRQHKIYVIAKSLIACTLQPTDPTIPAIKWDLPYYRLLLPNIYHLDSSSQPPVEYCSPDYHP